LELVELVELLGKQALARCHQNKNVQANENELPSLQPDARVAFDMLCEVDDGDQDEGIT
jgi:hypothetical protein